MRIMKFTKKKALKGIALVISGVVLYKAHENIPVGEDLLYELSNFAITSTRNSNDRSLTINLGGGNCKWQVRNNSNSGCSCVHDDASTHALFLLFFSLLFVVCSAVALASDL